MTDTLRRDTKQAIANIVQTVTTLKGVYTYRPKLVVATSFPYCVIDLFKAKETPYTLSRPVGKKKIEFNAQLAIYFQDSSQDGSGMLAFDDLLDEIDDALRSQPSLNDAHVGTTGIVLASAIAHIDTILSPPVLDGQFVKQIGVKQFYVTVQVNG